MRIDPRLKQVAENTAINERQTLTGLIEGLLIQHCQMDQAPAERGEAA